MSAPTTARPALPPCAFAPRPYTGPSYEEALAMRRRHVNPGVFTFYAEPLMLVEGKMQYMWDHTGKRYLDAFGGICTVSVGHCHPEVVAAASEQNETVQHVPTIYLHPAIGEYARLLTSTLPDPLSRVYFVNSGSEANDLAVLMARLHTGSHDIIALRNCYHGGNAAGMALTSHHTWKYDVPGPIGVHHARAPYPYRGPWGADDPEAGRKYAEDVREILDFATPGRVAGFIAESIQGVGGAVEFPPGYLEHAYAHVRSAGGVCIADEVQSGFGRTGTHFWGFETQGVVPDIVVMAKSIGNGFPLAAVVTTDEIAEHMTDRIHFNTFGGDPVAMVHGKKVLEIMLRDDTREHCRIIGDRLVTGLRALQDKHPVIGEVRGRGLMLGVELVKDRTTKEPATTECMAIIEHARELGLLLGKGGLWGNTLRIKPPMCLTADDADFLVAVIDAACAEAG
ncbi:MAG: aminotransferase class III-fold pyridoxal phosphate-dependent enzyme [Akkermansiaceae bacterium]|nr:aminotransferase class III-fold pyridoxal phosphate-dependent enzyme [Akkermansiaceae bacterium]NNM30451.1 aminotransferase class III-fold pyridoxal phosphate-dependent enzyme [Akkermansiaceae bacterium]